MPVLSFSPALTFLAAFGRVPPTQPLRTLIRTTGYRMRPPNPRPHVPRLRGAQDAAIASRGVGPHQIATVLAEHRRGNIPTIVLGGFVPNATEQVFLLRGFLLKSGSVYYFNYPPRGFSAEMLFAQLDDLVAELTQQHGTPPVIFAVSFGAGVLMEWLRRARQVGKNPELKGIVIVSPVACIEDLVTPGEAKPATLLGRAIKPYLDSRVRATASQIEKSRVIFSRMFEAGAQNKATLAMLMTTRELRHLHAAVLGTIAGIDDVGACERVEALRRFEPPSAYFSQALLPLTTAPTLILLAEKENAVIAPQAPTHFALRVAHRAYFSNSVCRTVVNHSGNPVQHASLIFHCFNFLPPLARFYRTLKVRKHLHAA